MIRYTTRCNAQACYNVNYINLRGLTFSRR